MSVVSRLQGWQARRHLVALARDGRVQLPERFEVRGAPIVEIVPGARLEVGEGVLLDSSQRGYHVAMWGPVRILADRPGAVVRIGDGTRVHASGIHAEESVSIGRRCLIAANCQLFDSNGHVLALDEPSRRLNERGPVRAIEIGDDVWLGTGVIVLPGTRIGDGAVVAAGSVVAGTVPPRTLVRGNPAVPVERPGHDPMRRAMASAFTDRPED